MAQEEVITGLWEAAGWRRGGLAPRPRQQSGFEHNLFRCSRWGLPL